MPPEKLYHLESLDTAQNIQETVVIFPNNIPIPTLAQNIAEIGIFFTKKGFYSMF